MELPSELFGIIAQFIPDHKTLVNLSLTCKAVRDDIPDTLYKEAILGKNTFSVNRRGRIGKASCQHLPTNANYYSSCDSHPMHITFQEKKVIEFHFYILKSSSGCGITLHGNCDPESGTITKFTVDNSRTAWKSYKYHFHGEKYPSKKISVTVSNLMVYDDDILEETLMTTDHWIWLRIAFGWIEEINEGRLDEIYRRVKRVNGGKEKKIGRCLLM